MSQKLSYFLMDPTRNMTILVETPVPIESQPETARKLMALEPEAEQVGFLSTSDHCDIALRMAGGEFCGNAAMSAALIHALGSPRESDRITVEVSGSDAPVTVTLSSMCKHSARGTLKMMKPVSIELRQLSETAVYPVVFFEGIAHVILEDTSTKANAEVLARQWCQALDQEAIGLMYYDHTHSSLTPLVYVKQADTMCWENACGSGSSAVGAYLAKKTGQPVSVSLTQPGGILEVSATPEGTILMSGKVSLVYQKEVEL
ncbi:MAG: hypothetical protein IJ225_01280 [Solobacterium sp.]|nr:hypothetical protein [Solobacterium sp.]